MAGAAKTARPASGAKSSFDMTERARLRSALLGYMQAHGIGAPTLQARIAKAADRSIDLIPLKTLQRFLAGAGRTNDAFLVPCHIFASGLPDHAGPEEATPETLAEMLGRFFFLNAGQGVSKPEALAGLQGRYELWTTKRLERQFRLRLFEGKEEDLVPYAKLGVESAPGAQGYAAWESVVNPRRQSPFHPADANARHRWEGGLVSFGRGSFILLRNNLTRMPKCYGLERSADESHEAYGIETPFLAPGVGGTDEARPLHVLFVRVTERTST